MTDPIINSTPQIPTISTAAVSTAPQPTKSNGFGRVLGGILGDAVNIVAPGLGSVLGGAMGGGASAADMQAMMNNQMQQSMQLLAVQNRVQSQSQQFTTFSNLLKTKHDSEMSAVSNFKT